MTYKMGDLVRTTKRTHSGVPKGRVGVVVEAVQWHVWAVAFPGLPYVKRVQQDAIRLNSGNAQLQEEAP